MTLEEKITEELYRRVLKKDRDLYAGQEYFDKKSATITALTEMTSLSENEVDQLAREVHSEVAEEYRRQNKLHLNMAVSGFSLLFIASLTVITLISAAAAWISAIVAISGLLVIFRYYKQFVRNRQIIIDNFDKKGHNWKEDSNFRQKRYIENNQYVFEGGTEDWCYWDSVDFKLPTKFTLEMTSLWKEGTYGTYGVMIADGDENNLTLELNARGAVSYSISKNSKKVINKSWKEDFIYKGSSKKKNTIKLKVDNDKFKYYVNDKLAYNGKKDILGDFVNIGLRVCDIQIVAFDSLRIMDDKTKAVLLDENFKIPHQDWTPKLQKEYTKSFENNQYIIETFRDEWCYWSHFPLDVSQACDFTLRAVWMEGETSNFGLIIYEEGDDYYSFQIQRNGKARYFIKRNGKTVFTANYTDTEYRGDGKKPVTLSVKIEKQKFEYYIDGIFVISGDFPQKEIKKISTSVCGFQKIAFDKLVVEEK